MKKIKNEIGFGTLIFSFLFLFNPNINIIDIFPDVIGYIILCSALSKLADMNDSLFRAKELFARMIVVDAVKIVAVFWVFGVSFRDEQNTLLLLVSFSLGVIELLTLIPAYSSLFEGLSALAYAHENNAVFCDGKCEKACEKAKRFTLFFVIFKVVMCVLPEFSVFSTQSYDEAAGMVNLYDFAPLLRIMAVILTLVFGIIWLCKMIRYFSRIKKDETFIISLVEEYNAKVLPKEGIFIKRKIKLAFILIGAFCLLCIDFRIDSFNILPDVFAAVVLIFAACVLKNMCPVSRVR